MSDIMRQIGFGDLMTRILGEYAKEGSIFGVRKLVRRTKEQARPIFREKIESPFGPAAGPNTQLAQNIVAAYVCGARFFELKTVQKMDGRELAACVPKPCIAAEDECYNCEWSTELTVEQAFEEYVKAWFACKVLARELGLGDPEGFVFNMSVGYDLEGIQTAKIDAYIEGMKNAEETPVFRECREWLLGNLGRFRKIDEGFVRSISPRISSSITESTLHGCPPDEIERIAAYLIKEKGLNTYVKCNPTLLGYDYARKRLDGAGFGYVSFDEHHFREDLQWEDAVPMFRRLMALSAERGLEFGLKLTNTFPVDVRQKELPSEEMYMSGRSLYLLTIHLVRRIAEEFGGTLRISYSGGADFFNIRQLADAGIWPVTMATTLLKPGGYERLSRIAELFEDAGAPFSGIDTAKAAALDLAAGTDPRYQKPVKPLPRRKCGEPLPLIDCFQAPCRTSCPISQDIPGYLAALEEGRTEDALRIILERNALPFITGTICPHTCTDRCMRGHYEESVRIRAAKLRAAEGAYRQVLPSLAKRGNGNGRRAAVIGGGPAGLAAAAFLSREGVPVTVFEKREKPGGIVRFAIPAFRIGEEAIDRDIALCTAYGAEIVTGREIRSVEELKAEGFTDVIAAVGAWKEGRNPLKYGEALDALDFLQAAKAAPESLKPGKQVIVIGGGNTAMDTARAAKRISGVEKVSLVYRRTKRYMPADEEELQMALDDGVEFRELLSPVGVRDGELVCAVCALGEPDASGRRSPVETGEEIRLPADTVICAVGERVDTSLFRDAGCAFDERGRVIVDEDLMTTVPGLYAVGDCKAGPATVVKGIADAQKAAAAISGCSFEGCVRTNVQEDPAPYLGKKGALCADCGAEEGTRCLGCPTVCQVCTDVCPNRANAAVRVPGKRMAQIIHVDGMCNECGNCAVFCPYDGRPYRDKFTLFGSREDFEDSENDGFFQGAGTTWVRLGGAVREYNVFDPSCGLYEDLRRLIVTVLTDYPYLLY